MLVLVAPLGAASGAAASSSAATRWPSDFDTLGQQFLDGVSELGRRAAEAGDALQRLLPGAGSATSAAAHDALPIEGVWKKASPIRGGDNFLDVALGVGWVKRRIAVNAAQTQTLRWTGSSIILDISDKRGTKRHEMVPHGKVVQGKGFMGLPVSRKVWWASKGSVIVMEERYKQHLGGDEHGSPCEGDACPLVRSTRGARGDEMYIEVERKLLNGKVVRMKTLFEKQREKPSALAFIVPRGVRTLLFDEKAAAEQPGDRSAGDGKRSLASLRGGGGGGGARSGDRQCAARPAARPRSPTARLTFAARAKRERRKCEAASGGQI